MARRNALQAEDQSPLNRNTPEQSDAVATCADWLAEDRSARMDVEEEWDQLDLIRCNRMWDLDAGNGYPLRTTSQQRNRPNSVENVTLSLIEGQVSEFCDDSEIVVWPSEEGDDEAARKMTELSRALLYKNRFEQERIRFLRDYFFYGPAIWEVVWDNAWQGGRGPNRWVGDVRVRRLNFRYFFPDARCREDLHDGTRVHKASYVALEYIKERYPEYGDTVGADIPDTSIEGRNLDDTSSTVPERDRALLVETWYIGRPLVLEKGENDEGTGLHVIWWAGESQQIYLRHANYVYYDPGEEPRFPFVFRGRYPRPNSFWPFGEAWFLKGQNVMLNKTSELVAEGHMHHSLGRTLYNEGALTPAQEKFLQENGMLPGVYAPVLDIAQVKTTYGEGVPGSLQTELERLRRSMESQTGRFDVSQGRQPGSVTAFRALDLLAQRAASRLKSASLDIQTALEDAGKLAINLMCRFYTEPRAYRLLGKTERDKPIYGMFRLADIQRVYNPATGTSRPLSALQGQAPAAAQEVYSPEFDVVVRTSQRLPSDRVFYMEMGKELYSGGLIDAETFFRVLEDGRFPPLQELIDKIQAQRQAQAQQVQPQVPLTVAAVVPVGAARFTITSPELPAVLGALQQIEQVAPAVLAQGNQVMPPRMTPEQQQQFAAATPDEQIAMVQAMMGGGQGAPQAG